MLAMTGIFSPLLSGVAHIFHTMAICTNSSRLLYFRPRNADSPILSQVRYRNTSFEKDWVRSPFSLLYSGLRAQVLYYDIVGSHFPIQPIIS